MQIRLHNSHRFVAAAIVLVQWAFMLTSLAHQSLWIDEWFTVQNIVGPWADVLPKLIAEERRPPLYWLVLKSWTAPSGTSEFSMHLLSVIFAVVATSVIWQVTRRMIGRRDALLATALFAWTPFLLLYGRMVRSYSLFALLVVISVLCWRQFEKKPSRGAWLAYAAALASVIYTDYGAIAMLGVHGLWWAWQFLQRRTRASLAGIAAVVTAFVIFAPWASVLVQQSARSVGGMAADLASSPLGALMKIAMPFVSLSTGETLYPWTPLGIIGVFVLNGTAAIGLWKLVRTQPTTGTFVVLWIVVTLTFTATLLTLVAVDITFMNATSRSPHLTAAFALLAALGIGSLPRHTRITVIAAVVVVWGAGYVNYFRLAEYHNPIYAIPSRDIAARMRAEDAHTLIVAESDTLVPYYFRSAPAQAQLIEVGINTSISVVEQRIANDGPAHVEIAWFGRDRTAGGFDTPALGEWLTQHGYVETRREEYGIVGDSYLAIKSRLIGRETYRAKLTVQRFERK